MGLVSDGGVHSSMEHAEAIISMAAKRGVKRVRVDAFTDGRDVDPQSGAGFMEDLQAFCAKVSKETGADVKIATVSGRYWGMDRDNRWEREEKAYNAKKKYGVLFTRNRARSTSTSASCAKSLIYPKTRSGRLKTSGIA